MTDNEYFIIARTLDLSIMGVRVPRVDAWQKVERAVIIDYKSTSVPDAMAWSTENTIVILQVESEVAVANLEKIIRVPGVDVSLVEMNDLSISLGGAGRF